MSKQYICKDCDDFGQQEHAPNRCDCCGSPRIIAHEELFELTIAHIDCDAFFASVEKRDNPELNAKPVIIGGGTRSVVATCCYIARQSGIHSAMPASTAKKLCPNAVFIKPNMQKYKIASKKIRTLMQQTTPLVEPISIDEAFLDLSGTAILHKASPAQTLVKLARKIETEVGVSVSIGLSHNKFLAKMASDIDKPRGFAIIGEKETLSFLAPKPISSIFGVGKIFAQKLKNDGFLTIEQLQNHPANDLIARYGEIGATLANISRGIDRRKIKTNRAAKSVSTEITFNRDISDFETLSTKLLELCEKLSSQLKNKQVYGDTITLKLKSNKFELRTRAKQIIMPTQLAHVIYEVAIILLQREIDGTLFRLIGIGVSGLVKGKTEERADLLEPKVAKKVALEKAMDKARNRFGKKVIIKGKLYQNNKKSDSH